MVDNQPKYITLSALSERIRIAIEEHSGGEQWVVAEVSTVQVNYSGHCYLELAERAEGQQMPRAVCRAVVWGNRYKIIANYFRHSTGSEIVSGMKILVKCTTSYHAVYGLSLVISDIDPTYTLGEVERVRLLTIAKLQKEGVFEMNKELELPAVIQTVAIISSATAAGYGDFMNELEKSAFRFDTTLFQAVMQGEGAENSIIEALEMIAQTDHYDAVIIIRGGGSANDLACFDNYELCTNIAQFPMPIITGIGHERDNSVADMVACLSLKTPTAVAAYLVDSASAFNTKLDRAEQFILQKSQQITINESRRIENISLRLQQIVKQNIHINSIKTHTLESSFRYSCSLFTAKHKGRCDELSNSIIGMAKNTINQQITTQNQLTKQLANLAANRIFAEKHRLEIATISVQASNPRRILKLGYAIVNGGLRSLIDVNINDKLTIEVADGTIKAKVEEKWQKNT